MKKPKEQVKAISKEEIGRIQQMIEVFTEQQKEFSVLTEQQKQQQAKTMAKITQEIKTMFNSLNLPLPISGDINECLNIANNEIAEKIKQNLAVNSLENNNIQESELIDINDLPEPNTARLNPEKKEWNEVLRKTEVITIPDIHGDIFALKNSLFNLKLIDRQTKWIGGNKVVQFTGDYIDRGKTSLEVLDFLKKITTEAEVSGGKINLMIGNHEAMMLKFLANTKLDSWLMNGGMQVIFEALGKFKMADAKTLDSMKLFLVNNNDDYFGLINAYKPEFGKVIAKLKQEIFEPNGIYFDLFDNMKVMSQIDDVLYLHGGISPEWAGIIDKKDYINEINIIWQTALEELRNGDLNKFNLFNDIGKKHGGKNDYGGPFWLDFEDESEMMSDSEVQNIAEILKRKGLNAIIVGHRRSYFPQMADNFNKFGIKLICADVGMSNVYGSRSGKGGVLIDKKGNIRAYSSYNEHEIYKAPETDLQNGDKNAIIEGNVINNVDMAEKEPKLNEGNNKNEKIEKPVNTGEISGGQKEINGRLKQVANTELFSQADIEALLKDVTDDSDSDQDEGANDNEDYDLSEMLDEDLEKVKRKQEEQDKKEQKDEEGVPIENAFINQPTVDRLLNGTADPNKDKGNENNLGTKKEEEEKNDEKLGKGKDIFNLIQQNQKNQKLISESIKDIEKIGTNPNIENTFNQQEREQLEKEIIKLKAEKIRLENSKQDIICFLEECETEKTQAIQDAIKAKEKELETAKANFEIAKTEAIEKAVEDKAEELQKLQTEKKELYDIINRKEEEISDLAIRKKGIEILKSQAEEALKDKEKKLETAKVNFEIAKTEAIEKAVEDKAEELQKLQTEKKELNDIINKKEEEISDLAIRKKGIEILKSQAEEALKDKEKELETAKANFEIAKTEAIEKAVEDKAEELQKLQTEKKELQKERQLAVYKRNQTIIDKISEHEDEKNIEIEKVKTELETVKKEAEELETVKKEAEELKTAKTKAEEELETAKTKAEELKTAKTKAEEALKDKEKKLETAKVNFEIAKTEAIEKAVEDKAEELQKLQTEKKELQKERQLAVHKRNQTIIDKISEHEDEKNIEIEKVKTELETAKKEAEDAVKAKGQELEQLKTELETAKVNFETEKTKAVQDAIKNKEQEFETAKTKAEEALKDKEQEFETAKTKAEEALKDKEQELKTVKKEFAEKEKNYMSKTAINLNKQNNNMFVLYQSLETLIENKVDGEMKTLLLQQLNESRGRFIKGIAECSDLAIHLPKDEKQNCSWYKAKKSIGEEIIIPKENIEYEKTGDNYEDNNNKWEEVKDKEGNIFWINDKKEELTDEEMIAKKEQDQKEFAENEKKRIIEQYEQSNFFIEASKNDFSKQFEKYLKIISDKPLVIIDLLTLGISNNWFKNKELEELNKTIGSMGKEQKEEFSKNLKYYIEKNTNLDNDNKEKCKKVFKEIMKVEFNTVNELNTAEQEKINKYIESINNSIDFKVNLNNDINLVIQAISETNLENKKRLKNVNYNNLKAIRDNDKSISQSKEFKDNFLKICKIYFDNSYIYLSEKSHVYLNDIDKILFIMESNENLNNLNNDSTKFPVISNWIQGLKDGYKWKNKIFTDKIKALNEDKKTAVLKCLWEEYKKEEQKKEIFEECKSLHNDCLPDKPIKYKEDIDKFFS